jgi:hypothetical protein
MRKIWKIEADKRELVLYSFSSVDNFLLAKLKLEPSKTYFYIDSALGDELLGENEALRIYELGFHHLYLASAKTQQEIINKSYILGNIGKHPFFHIDE